MNIFCKHTFYQMYCILNEHNASVSQHIECMLWLDTFSQKILDNFINIHIP